MRNVELLGKYFSKNIRALGDFAESPYNKSAAEIERMSVSDKEKYEAAKQGYFTRARRNGIDGSIRPFAVGGSDIGTIKGVGFKSPRSLAFEKAYPNKAKEVIDAGTQDRFDTGHRAEDFIRNSFELKTGIKTMAWDVQMNNIKYPHCVANIDGLLFEDGKMGIYEGKCLQSYPSQKNWIQIQKNGNRPEDIDLVPLKYVLQVYFYLAVCELDFAYICGGGWGFSKNDIAYVRIERLPAADEYELMQAAENFVARVSKRDFEGISEVGFSDEAKVLETYAKIWPQSSSPKASIDISKFEGTLRAYKNIDEKLKELDDQIEGFKASINYEDYAAKLKELRVSIIDCIASCGHGKARFDDGLNFEVDLDWAKPRLGFDKELCMTEYPEVFGKVYHPIPAKKPSLKIKINSWLSK